MPTYFDNLKSVGGSELVERFRTSSVSRAWGPDELG